MSHPFAPSDTLSGDHGLRLQSGTGEVAELDAEAEGECGGLGGCEGAADEVDEGERESVARSSAPTKRRSEAPVRMPVFDWNSNVNTFEWILHTAAALRVERELDRISRRR